MLSLATSTVDVRLVVKHTFIEVQGVEAEAEKARRKAARRRTDMGPTRIPHIVELTSGDETSSISVGDDATRMGSFCSVDSDNIIGRHISMSSEWSEWSGRSMDVKTESLFAACSSSSSTLSLHSDAPWRPRLPTDSSCSSGSFDNQEQHRDFRSTTTLHHVQNPSDAQKEHRTTVMVRNIPTHLSQIDFVRELSARGYRNLFTFVYMPMNLRSYGSFGYAFVDLIDATVAVQLMKQLQLQEDGWRAIWSSTQGMTANVERYRNSPLMHETVPAECKPALYDEHGVQVPFPAPTKYLAKPRIHYSKSKPVQKEKGSTDMVATAVAATCGSNGHIKPRHHPGRFQNSRR